MDSFIIVIVVFFLFIILVIFLIGYLIYKFLRYINFQPNGEGCAPSDRSISISKTSNELRFEDIDD